MGYLKKSLMRFLSFPLTLVALFLLPLSFVLAEQKALTTPAPQRFGIEEQEGIFELLVKVEQMRDLSGNLEFMLTDDKTFFNKMTGSESIFDKNKTIPPTARVFTTSYPLFQLSTQYDTQKKQLSLVLRLDRLFKLPANETERPYAIALFHDENGNGELDTDFIGIPQEPVGNSIAFGKERSLVRPRFKDSSFLVKRGVSNAVSVELFNPSQLLEVFD